MDASKDAAVVTVKIDGYLVQEKLEKALAAIVGETSWRGKEVQVVSGRRQRWDMVYEGLSGKVAVEFDGDEHYRHTLKIKGDREKDELAKLGGIVPLVYLALRMVANRNRPGAIAAHEPVEQLTHAR